MRSLIIALACVSCCGSRPTVRHEASAMDDPELAMACAPDWSTPPPDACASGEDGSSILQPGDPSYRMVAQILSLEKMARGSAGTDEAIVKLATMALANDEASACGRQVCRWHRALALQRLNRWREAFLDFGSAIKDGPNNPFYEAVGARIDALRPNLPENAVIACLASYGLSSYDETAPMK